MMDFTQGESSNEWWIDGSATEAALRGERLAVFGDGHTVRAWTDVVERRGAQRRWLLRAQAYDAQGEPDSEVFTLSARPSACAQGFRGSALAGRRFAVLWTENCRGESELHACTRVFDLRGFPPGADYVLGRALCSEPDSLAIAPAADGGYVGGWIGADGNGAAHVQAAAFDALGVARAGALCVSTRPVITPCSVKLTRLDGGGFVVSWADEPRTRTAPVRTQMFDASGERVGDEFLCSFRK